MKKQRNFIMPNAVCLAETRFDLTRKPIYDILNNSKKSQGENYEI